MDSTPGGESKHKQGREIIKGAGVLVLLVLMMAWLAGAFTQKTRPGPPEARNAASTFNTYKVEGKTYPLVIEQVGTVRAHDEARISSRLLAQVKEVLVREGDMVSGGEGGGPPTVLAKLDDAEIQAKLRQAKFQAAAMARAVEVAKAKLQSAKAQVESAKAVRDRVVSDYRRYEELRRSQAATGQQVDHARSQKDTAEAQVTATSKDVEAAQSEIARALAMKEQADAAVSEAGAMLGYTLIEAPFTGRIISKKVNAGDMVSPGEQLLLLETTSSPELHCFVSETFLPDIQSNEDLEIHIDALDRDFSGKVREISPQSDPRTRTVMVKVGLPSDKSLVNGLFGRLRIVYGHYKTLVAPSSALREVGQLNLAEVVGADGQPERRFVTLGKRHGDLVEILSGLQENTQVILK